MARSVIQSLIFFECDDDVTRFPTGKSNFTRSRGFAHQTGDAAGARSGSPAMFVCCVCAAGCDITLPKLHLVSRSNRKRFNEAFGRKTSSGRLTWPI
jgi:hypothetical protein